MSWAGRIAFIVILGSGLVPAEGAESKPKAKTAASTVQPEKKSTGPATKPEEKTPARAEAPTAARPTARVQWLGHSFIYITTSTGVRIGIDPFDESIRLPFPAQLFSEVLLVSSTRDDHAGVERMNSLAVFRGDAALGPNRAHGYIFNGLKSYQDDDRGREMGNNTIFAFEVDGVRFVHLGSLGHALDTRQKDEMGRVDVLFLPVGLKQNSVAAWNKIARDTGAKIIIPLNYQTKDTPNLDLRPLDEFLQDQTFPLKKLDLPYFDINPNLLPSAPTVYLLPYPPLVPEAAAAAQ
jgi:L-ascorbate metabolism protein UlaG (beta-lactamase superfamily)